MDVRLKRLEHACQALGDATRLRIIGLLAGGEVCVCHIYEALRIPQPKASRHLAYLRRAGLVEGRKEGLWVHYRLAQPDDPSVRTLLETALHTLGHVSTTKVDEQRLCRLVDRPARVGRRLPVLACCSPST